MITLEGWWCSAPRDGGTSTCRTFNGEVKGKVAGCRVCGAPRVAETGLGRDELLRAVAALARENVQLGEQIAKAHGRCSQMLDVARAAKRYVDLRDEDDFADVEQVRLDAAAVDLHREVQKLRSLEDSVSS
jgi:hypothetical protein